MFHPEAELNLYFCFNKQFNLFEKPKTLTVALTNEAAMQTFEHGLITSFSTPPPPLPPSPSPSPSLPPPAPLPHNTRPRRGQPRWSKGARGGEGFLFMLFSSL